KLFRNDGTGRFTDVTAKAGDLAPHPTLSPSLGGEGRVRGASGKATCAAWGDFDNDGYLDLVVGYHRGPNRLFRNKGDGTFEDITDKVGLGQRIFNTQAICLVDLNGDGMLDMVFNNEGQESVVLLGNPEFAAKRTPVVVQVGGMGAVGSKVKVATKDGKAVAMQEISGGDGRGGQQGAHARFALPPGTYKVEVHYSSGIKRGKEITVASAPMRNLIDEQTPKLD